MSTDIETVSPKDLIVNAAFNAASKAAEDAQFGIRKGKTVQLYKNFGNESVNIEASKLNVEFNFKTNMVIFGGLRMQDSPNKDNLETYFQCIVENEELSDVIVLSNGLFFDRPISAEDAQIIGKAWATLTSDIV